MIFHSYVSLPEGINGGFSSQPCSWWRDGLAGEKKKNELLGGSSHESQVG